MDYFRQIGKQTLLLWALLLCSALLCTQGAKLHTHNLDHGPNDEKQTSYHFHTLVTTDDHGQLNETRFDLDNSHYDHHDNVISEVNIDPGVLLKSSNNNAFFVTLFVLFFTLITFTASRRFIQRYREITHVLHRNYILSPPLRAPPRP